MEFVIQERRQPKEPDPPDRIGKKFSDGKCPCLPVWYQPCPRDLSCRFFRVGFDVGKFAGREFWIFFGAAIQQEPEDKPDKTKRACKNKCPLPTIRNR